MKNEFMISAPDWLKDVKDDDVYAAIFTLLTEWESDKPKQVSSVKTELTDVFELSDKQAEEAIKLLISHKVLNEA